MWSKKRIEEKRKKRKEKVGCNRHHKYHHIGKEFSSKDKPWIQNKESNVKHRRENSAFIPTLCVSRLQGCFLEFVVAFFLVPLDIQILF